MHTNSHPLNGAAWFALGTITFKLLADDTNRYAMQNRYKSPTERGSLQHLRRSKSSIGLVFKAHFLAMASWLFTGD